MDFMYSAIDIANWFLWKNEVERIENESETDDYEVYERLSHLKLQKLLYFVQGVYLAFMHQPLFFNKIEAWEHGPVIRDVYNEFSSFGKNDIDKELTKEELDIIRKIELDEDASEILNLVYEKFGGFTAWQLREKSHVKGGPWYVTVSTFGMNSEISPSLIEDYFSKYIIDNG